MASTGTRRAVMTAPEGGIRTTVKKAGDPKNLFAGVPRIRAARRRSQLGVAAQSQGAIGTERCKSIPIVDGSDGTCVQVPVAWSRDELGVCMNFKGAEAWNTCSARGELPKR